MVDTLGLPTVFFTHSAADGQWPELARLICPENEHCSSSRSSAVSKNPAIADWFISHRISKFLDAFYVGILGASDYWFRFEWQHRGSPHVHGVAWFKDAPKVEQLLASQDDSDVIAAAEKITSYVDGIVSTNNPAIAPDGSNPECAPLPKTRPHVCNKPYAEVEDINMDLVDLIATCQCHTRCSIAYCLKKRKGKQECRFGFPKPLQPVTSIVTEDGEPELLTARNDSLLNSYNPVQLSAWRANVDMQYVLSRRRVIHYVAKYATKPEPRSKALKRVFSNIMSTLKDDGTPLQVVQKLLISSVGERDYSAQETCHLLLQLPMFRASRDFVILSLDGSREVDDRLEDDRAVTLDSQLDHYTARPATAQFEELTLLQFVQKYRIPKRVGDDLVPRTKEVVVIPRPYCSPDPSSPKYEQYCKQNLMMHRSFRQLEQLLGACDSHADAYSLFLQSGASPPSLADDIYRIEAMETENRDSNAEEEQEDLEESDGDPSSTMQDWMLLCQHRPEFTDSVTNDGNVDWSLAAKAYPNLDELPHFIAQNRQHHVLQNATTIVDIDRLQGKQLHAYSIVRDHFEDEAVGKQTFRMIVSGTAGTGKSYLIQCLRLLLGDCLYVAAPTGPAAYNVDGYTLHSLLALPVKSDFKELEGNRLQTMQESLTGIDYLIIDEMSMVGRKLFGQVDRRLRQAFPHRAEELFGGCSILLIGDFGQLPPVMDLPLYTTVSRTELSDLGSANYRMFDRAVVLDQVMRQAGQDADQQLFRHLLYRLRNGESTLDDWGHLMRQTPVELGKITPFDGALRLYPTTQAVAEYNIGKLWASGQPVAMIKAVHSGSGASKASTDDAGGLESVVCIAHGARVMLTANLWVNVGLVNGAIGTVAAICYLDGQCPPDLPVAVMVHFDSYTGPTLPDGTVPIIPLRRTWFATTQQCSRLQLPLKLAWAVTIHKAQGMTLDRVVIDVGKKEFSSGLTFMACSRVRHLTDLLFVPPFSFQRVAGLNKSSRLKERLQEDERLQQMSATSSLPRDTTSHPISAAGPTASLICAQDEMVDEGDEAGISGSLPSSAAGLSLL